MNMPELQKRLWYYVSSLTNLDQFKDWFIAESWDVENQPDQSLADFVQRVKLRLAEFSNDDLNESELRGELMSLLMPPIAQPSIFFSQTFPPPAQER